MSDDGPEIAAARAAGVRVALAGGGTGGHVVPGVAIVEQFAAMGRLAGVLWLGSGRPAEVRALAGLENARRGAPARVVALPLERGGAPSRFATLARLPRAVLAARRELAAARSDVVVGLGGFASAAAVIAARTLGLPVVMLEVNAAPGLATRVLAPLARAVLHASEASLPAGRGSRHRVAGPFLSRALFAPPASDTRRAEARRGFGLEAERPLVVVLGGSQGAGALNAFVRAHVATLVGEGLSVLHQVGPGRLGEAASPSTHYRAIEYTDDVPLVLDAATVAIARAGASTLAEIVARRVPAFVVPYPHAAKDHQRANALGLGDAVIVADETALDETFARRVAHIASDDGAGERAILRQRLSARIAPDGAACAAREIEALVDAPRDRRAPAIGRPWVGDLARETR